MLYYSDAGKPKSEPKKITMATFNAFNLKHLRIITGNKVNHKRYHRVD